MTNKTTIAIGNIIAGLFNLAMIYFITLSYVDFFIASTVQEVVFSMKTALVWM